MGEFTHAIMPANIAISISNLAQDLLTTPAMQDAMEWWDRTSDRAPWSQLGCSERTTSYMLPAGFGIDGRPYTLELFHQYRWWDFLANEELRAIILAVGAAAARIVAADRILWISETGRYPLSNTLDVAFQVSETCVRESPDLVELQCDRIYTYKEVRSFPESKFEFMLQRVRRP
ncbi:MAG: hypothetical protein H6819_00080 [Phycisphaerales bacterium]|nr:hypothetical protein [Phycisphaerales bacterium]MCB9857396.1 hypothetical protein [Phycisphaerales bacterium]MCB9864989.1 hypothetical protein [Phycisphaerales bacterium]